ncbi:MAG TPA: hypothetical protein DCF93_06350 [Desulfuromonas sp.]|nr:hypothetical protein [Desulfuromonas sp.]
MNKFVRVLMYGLIMALSATGVASAKDEALEKAFAGLDQALIPALFVTSAADQRLSEASLTLLNNKWAAFRQSYDSYRPDYANWGSYIDGIATDLIEANSIVFSGAAPLVDAHESLEGIRVILVDFRGKNGFPKFSTDKQTLYHEPMEAIALTVKGKTPLTLTDAAVAFVAATLPATQKAWHKVEKCPVDPEIWGFTPTQMVTLYNYIAAESQALDNLQIALDSGNKQAIIAAGMGIKQGFVPVYTFFGDFKSVNLLAAQNP